MGTYIDPPVFNSGAGGDTIPPSRHLSCYRRVTSKGYPTLGTYTTLGYHFYYATCPHRCIHESLLVLYQLGNCYGRYTAHTPTYPPSRATTSLPAPYTNSTPLVNSLGATAPIPCSLLPHSRLVVSPVTRNPPPH